MPRTDDLYRSFLAAGLPVRQRSGWETRGGRWAAADRPIAVMHHHTAPPVPFPLSKLDGSLDGRIKCNINTKPDGTIWLVAYNACNYSSGPGSSQVWRDVRNGVVPTGNAKSRDLWDDMNGNPWYWNFENDHPGDGSPIPQDQFNSIVGATMVILLHYDLPKTAIISHAEWTRRKIDPLWSTSNRVAITQIRNAVEEGLEMATGPNGEPNWDAVADWAKSAWSWAWSEGILSPSTHPKETVTKEELMVFFQRDEADEGDNRPSTGGVTEARVRQIIEGSKLKTQ